MKSAIRRCVCGPDNAASVNEDLIKRLDEAQDEAATSNSPHASPARDLIQQILDNKTEGAMLRCCLAMLY